MIQIEYCLFLILRIGLNSAHKRVGLTLCFVESLALHVELDNMDKRDQFDWSSSFNISEFVNIFHTCGHASAMLLSLDDKANEFEEKKGKKKG